MSKRSPGFESTSSYDAIDSKNISPLLLCDHLIHMAREADRVGYTVTAARLIDVIECMFDDQ